LFYSFSVGEIAIVGESEFEQAITGEFASRISFAEELIQDTRTSEDGEGIYYPEHWAKDAAHKAFQFAIDRAKASIERIRKMHVLKYVKPSDEFTLTLGINDNTGFASMMLQLTIPEGLELTRVEIVGFDGLIMLPLVVPSGSIHDEDTGEITPPIQGNESVVVACFGTADNTDNGELLIYTFRVLNPQNEGITVIDPITVAFANGNAVYTLPTNADGERLDMLPPGHLIPSDNIGELRSELPFIICSG
jgi:hypothetical protein